MDYFLSHLPQIFIAALIVSAAAILWSFSLWLAAKRKRERKEKLRAEALKNAEANAVADVKPSSEELSDDSDDQWRMLR